MSITATQVQTKPKKKTGLDKALLNIYSFYTLVVFLTPFFLFYPFYLILVQKESMHRWAVHLNRWWSTIFFKFSFIPVEIEYHAKLDKKQTYVLCANHFSFLDIAIIGLLPIYNVFVGKSSLGKIPLFGYMFRKLHITVNRESMKNKYESLIKSKKAIDIGKSVTIFPEGGITNNHPQVGKFKDGAFRLAIEKQVPIVPVTLPYNWIIFPDERKLEVYRRKAKIVVHEPIPTKGLTLEDMDGLRDRVYTIIDQELKKHN